MLLLISLFISGMIQQITKPSFNKLINKRDPKTVWIVLFYSPSNYESEKAYPKFVDVSKEAGGLFKFGVVDTKTQSILCRSLKIKNIPVVRIYHHKGFSDYHGKLNPSELISAAGEYIQSNIKELNLSKKAFTVLFTENSEPLIWRAISQRFKNVFISSNRTIAADFGINDFPGIVFVNRTTRFVYDDEMEFSAIERDYSLFRQGKLKAKDAIPKEILPSTMIADTCVSGEAICIINTDPELNDDYKEIKRLYAGLPYKWFYGYDGVPFDFMKKNEIWIFNPKVDGFYNVDLISSLGTVLERVYEAKIEWKRKFDITKEL